MQNTDSVTKSGVISTNTLRKLDFQKDLADLMQETITVGRPNGGFSEEMKKQLYKLFKIDLSLLPTESSSRNAASFQIYLKMIQDAVNTSALSPAKAVINLILNDTSVASRLQAGEHALLNYIAANVSLTSFDSEEQKMIAEYVASLTSMPAGINFTKESANEGTVSWIKDILETWDRLAPENVVPGKVQGAVGSEKCIPALVPSLGTAYGLIEHDVTYDKHRIDGLFKYWTGQTTLAAAPTAAQCKTLEIPTNGVVELKVTGMRGSRKYAVLDADVNSVDNTSNAFSPAFVDGVSRNHSTGFTVQVMRGTTAVFTFPSDIPTNAKPAQVKATFPAMKDDYISIIPNFGTAISPRCVLETTVSFAIDSGVVRSPQTVLATLVDTTNEPIQLLEYAEKVSGLLSHVISENGPEKCVTALSANYTSNAEVTAIINSYKSAVFYPSFYRSTNVSYEVKVALYPVVHSLVGLLLLTPFNSSRVFQNTA